MGRNAMFGKHIKDEQTVRNRLATEPVILKVCNIKLSFDI